MAPDVNEGVAEGVVDGAAPGAAADDGATEGRIPEGTAASGSADIRGGGDSDW